MHFASGLVETATCCLHVFLLVITDKAQEPGDIPIHHGPVTLISKKTLVPKKSQARLVSKRFLKKEADMQARWSRTNKVRRSQTGRLVADHRASQNGLLRVLREFEHFEAETAATTTAVKIVLHNIRIPSRVESLFAGSLFGTSPSNPTTKPWCK